MKIAIPVDEKTLETVVSVAFGRAQYFLIYDISTKEKKFIDNPAATTKGGAGIMAAQVIVDSKVDALLTPRCGQNAADVIRGSGIDIYKTSRISVKENITEFSSGNLSELNEIHPGRHGGR